MTPFEAANKYYPTLWSKDRLKALVVAGKLTTTEYTQITGEEYTEG
jgi:hypothetical protein